MKANEQDHRTRTETIPPQNGKLSVPVDLLVRPCDSAIDRYTFAGWIQLHDPEYEWDWGNPEDVIKHFVLCVSGGCVAGLNINLEPVFDLFFSQGLSGMDMALDGPEGIWLNYLRHLRVNNEA